MDAFINLLFEHSSNDESSSESEEVDNQREPREFDIRLTSTHKYLQANEFGDVNGSRNFDEPNSILTVPILAISNVLLPGQILPLYFEVPRCIDFVRTLSTSKTSFGLITLIDEPFFKTSKIGTLFQLQNVSENNGKLTLQALGRQRFELIKILNFRDAYESERSCILFKDVKIRVLDELTLPHLINMPEYTLNRLPSKLRCKWYAQVISHNSQILTQLSTDSVIVWLKKWLQKWFDSNRINVIIDQSYSMFSYWVASNLPVDLKTKLELLNEDCADRRLRLEWNIASQMNYLACKNCGDIKCEIDDLINLSVEANGTHFVNPQGYVHELFTVIKIKNISLIGRSSKKFSWFPGYTWTPINCEGNGCSVHLGWKFTSSKLLPKIFYGICRGSFKLVKAENENNEVENEL